MPLFTPEDLSCVAIGKSHSLKYPYGPFRISGLVDFHRSDMGVTLSGSDVTDWADKSGKAHDLSQGTAARRPVFTAGQIGDWGVIDFGPGFVNDKFLDWATNWAHTSDETSFVVVKFTVSNADFQILFLGVTGQSRYLGSTGADVNKPMIFSSMERAVWTTALTDGTNYIIKHKTRDLSTGPQQYWTQVNGAAEVNTSVVGTADPDQFNCLGMDPAIVTSQDLVSKIAEFFVYDRALQAIEEAWARVYTASRYKQGQFLT